MDSPRGRIYLMARLSEGAKVTREATEHLDRCLGCLACVTACPSGVDYERLLQATRAQLERHGVRSLRARVARRSIFALFPYRARLRPVSGALAISQGLGVLRVLRRLGPRLHLPASLQTSIAVAPDSAAHIEAPVLSRTSGPSRGRVALLTGCVQDAFFSEVNRATIAVLNAEGFDVVAPRNQGCCGALSSHSGRVEEAREFARALIDVFEATSVDAVLVNSAGCGSAMKHYAALLRNDSKYLLSAERLSSATKDITEFLAEIEPRAPRHPLPLEVAYHDACHLCHGQNIRDAPRALLSRIPGLEIKAIDDAEACCGSAGIYNLVQPEIAHQIGAAKAHAIKKSGARVVASGNPGCNLQIAAALREIDAELPVRHTIELLAASIADTSVKEMLRPPAGIRRRLQSALVSRVRADKQHRRSGRL